MADDKGYKGQAKPSSTSGQYNAHVFLINSLIGKCNHVSVCKIVACTNSGGVSPVGFVDITPMVNLVDGSGQIAEHDTIYHCLYFRLQGGSNAIIIDPEPGDIGICCFADRDISKVKATKAKAAPGSNRRFDWSDGIYMGGVLNGVPSQYIQFASDGINIVSGKLTHNGVNIGSNHTHKNVTTGSGNTGVPNT